MESSVDMEETDPAGDVGKIVADNSDTSFMENLEEEEKNFVFTTPLKVEGPVAKRKYNKVSTNPGLETITSPGLSGNYWTSPSAKDTGRPKRLNAGSRMIEALKELDGHSSKKKSPPATKPTTGLRDSEPEYKPSTSRKLKKQRKTFRVQPYEKPLTRGRGRPRKDRPEEDKPVPPIVKSVDKETSKSETKANATADLTILLTKLPVAEKSTPKNIPNEKVTISNPNSPGKTVDRKSEKSVVQIVPSQLKTYGRRKSIQLQDKDKEVVIAEEEAVEKDSSPNKLTESISKKRFLSAARVTPSMALIAVLSIPDEILPTSHETFLNKFRETQEKSPTPPGCLVLNLDEVVANYKSTHVLKPDQVKVVVVPDSVPEPCESEKSETDSNSGSTSSSQFDEKENIESIAAALKTDTRLGKVWVWEEDEKVAVVKLGNNQLLICNKIVDIDYTNYVKESDVSIPYDYDVVFQPELKFKLSSGTWRNEISNPSTPSTVSKGDEDTAEEAASCKLEACKKGCICESLKLGVPVRDHCGKLKCMLECTCLFIKQILIKGDEKNIRTRLRPRVTLLNWKDITKNGGSDQPDSAQGTSEAGSVAKKHKKTKLGKAKKNHSVLLGEPSIKRFKTSKGGAKYVVHATAQPLPSLVVTKSPKPVTYSSKPAKKPLMIQGRSLALASSPVKGQGAAAQVQIIQARSSPVKKPIMISTGVASSVSSKRIYSCSPCHVRLRKMPKHIDDWSDIEKNSFSGGSQVQKKLSSQTASSSKPKIASKEELSFAVVRPNGSILALLYWETITKVSPRSFQSKSRNNEATFPWLYLPTPNPGKVWLFYEIPQFPKQTPHIWLPELSVFLPTDKLMLMMYEANKTTKTSKLYFESEDESKFCAEGMQSFVYLVPHLPSLIIYGPVTKSYLNIPTPKTTEATMKMYEESETSKNVKRQLDLLDAAGTDVSEVTDGEFGVREYADNVDRADNSVEQEIWEDVYNDYLIPVDGQSDSPASSSDGNADYDYEYDWEEQEYDAVQQQVKNASNCERRSSPMYITIT